MRRSNQKWKHLTCNTNPETGRRVPTREYNAWSNMLKRCNNPKSDYYYRYGGRGIRVCERWHNYDNFYEDMCPIPKGLQIDRIDGDKGYYKENCRLVTPTVQARNCSCGHFITYKGKTQRLIEWAEEYGLTKSILSDRINKCKWPLERAFNEPINESHQKPVLSVTYKNETKTLSQWCKDCRTDYSTVWQRIFVYGWTVGQALGFEDRPEIRRTSIRHTFE